MKVRELGMEREVLELKGKGKDNKNIARELSKKYDSDLKTGDVTRFLNNYNNIILSEKIEGNYKDKLINQSLEIHSKLDQTANILYKKIKKYSEGKDFLEEKQIPKFANTLQKNLELKSKLIGELKDGKQDSSVDIANEFNKFINKAKKKKREMEEKVYA